MAKDTRRQCTAKSRRTGKQCQSYAEKDGKGLCYHHRGRLTVGKPNFIHGLYSRGLNAKEKAEWEEVPLGNVDDEIRLARFFILTPDS